MIDVDFITTTRGTTEREREDFEQHWQGVCVSTVFNWGDDTSENDNIAAHCFHSATPEGSTIVDMINLMEMRGIGESSNAQDSNEFDTEFATLIDGKLEYDNWKSKTLAKGSSESRWPANVNKTNLEWNVYECNLVILQPWKLPPPIKSWQHHTDTSANTMKRCARRAISLPWPLHTVYNFVDILRTIFVMFWVTCVWCRLSSRYIIGLGLMFTTCPLSLSPLVVLWSVRWAGHMSWRASESIPRSL